LEASVPGRHHGNGAARGNDLEIRIVDLWPNRPIGDEELPPENEYSGIDVGMGGFGALFAGKIARLPDWYVQGKPKPAGGRVAFTTWRFFRKGDPLYESGLLGPVRLRTAVRRSIST
jgi:hypothetical protein